MVRVTGSFAKGAKVRLRRLCKLGAADRPLVMAISRANRRTICGLAHSAPCRAGSQPDRRSRRRSWSRLRRRGSCPIDGGLAKQPSLIDKPKRALPPVVRERQNLADADHRDAVLLCIRARVRFHPKNRGAVRVRRAFDPPSLDGGSNALRVRPGAWKSGTPAMHQDRAARGKENRRGWTTRRVSTPETCPTMEHSSPPAALNRHGCRPD